MAYHIAKPLPDVPNASMMRLTIDSNNLLSSLIKRHVEEEGLEDSWIDVVEHALTKLGDYLHSESIISKLQATRKSQIRSKVATDIAKLEQRRKDRDRWKDSKSGKNKVPEKFKEVELANVDYPTSPVPVDVKLNQLADLTLKTPEGSMTHLFLTVAPFLESPEEHDFEHDVLPAIGCVFVSDTYCLPFYEESGVQYGHGGIVLCGLDNWMLDDFKESPRIAGGTFTFHNVMSATAHESLVSTLRLSIYAYLSLVLEQCVLLDFQISLRYPPQPQILPQIITPSNPLPISTPVSVPLIRKKSRSIKSTSSIWSFISKKTEGIIHRVSGSISENMNSPFIRTGSVSSPSKVPWRSPRSSEETPRANSEMEPIKDTIKPSFTQAVEEERRDREKYGPFSSAIRRVQDQASILSTSPQTVFPPPRLIVFLAQREEEQKLTGLTETGSGSSLSSSTSSMTVPTPSPLSGTPTLRLTGIDKTALGNVLGWESRESRGKGMTGVKGFVRHQGLTFLYAEQVLIGEEKFACGRPKLITYRYWSRCSAADASADQTIGEFIEHACEKSVMQERCETEGCEKERGMHSMSWTCNGVNVKCTSSESSGSGHEDRIDVWQSCAVCGKSTEHESMSNGAYLYSFAKFLEMLIWSPIMCTVSLCEHTAPSSPISQAGNPLLSPSRYHIQRHFRRNGHTLTITTRSVENNIYEVRFPKLQIVSSSAPRDEKHLSDVRKKREGEEERHKLMTEIEEWWSDIKGHVDKLEEFLEKEAQESLHSKDLPPLPASDDEDSDDELPPSRPRSQYSRPKTFRSISASSQKALEILSGQSKWPVFIGNKPSAQYPPGSAISLRESRMLLARLRASFQLTENTLRKRLLDTPTSSLNDARRAFRSTARGALKRLVAWQFKHAPGAPMTLRDGDGACTVPDWWSGHAVPGGRVVVREGESGSIIAFTLSAVDYQRELANLNTVSGITSSSTTSTISALSEHYFLDSDATIKSGKFPTAELDPDTSDMAVWEEKEACTAVISRREHPREGSTLLGLRDVLRTKRSFDGSSSRFSGSVSGSVLRGVAGLMPPSAWAQAQVQVNLEPADGLVSQFPQAAESFEKALESHYYLPSRSASPVNYDGGITPTPSSFVERHVRRGDLSIISSDSEREGVVYNEVSVPLVAPQPTTITSTVLPPSAPSGYATPPGSSSFTGALSSAMRYFLNPATPPSRVPSPAPQGGLHGLLAYESTSAIDEHPHIKYDWTIGQRLKFSCTVYYAKQFDTLRKRCGVDTDVIKSLERSENWTAVGGKSRSNFWKSADGRFIIKTLVNAWNVADLQVLIELAPSYFRYLDSTANKASAFAKLMGFYTVEVKNLETGVVQAKHDLLVMENLFYKHKIARTYDLKGIQSRKVKPNQDSAERTLFDGEWLEAQQRAPILIQPHSGYVLHEAIRADADFLAKSNIMDYSLLLGIDEERHEIACGLVDTIGSYTFAKTLEYKAKHNLHSGKGKEVTVIPPAEYHNRFIASMEQYFLTCPDKWTKPPHFIDRIRTVDLPSVL